MYSHTNQQQVISDSEFDPPATCLKETRGARRVTKQHIHQPRREVPGVICDTLTTPAPATHIQTHTRN
jgi:hypothetical protein